MMKAKYEANAIFYNDKIKLYDETYKNYNQLISQLQKSERGKLDKLADAMKDFGDKLSKFNNENGDYETLLEKLSKLSEQNNSYIAMKNDVIFQQKALSNLQTEIENALTKVQNEEETAKNIVKAAKEAKIKEFCDGLKLRDIANKIDTLDRQLDHVSDKLLNPVDVLFTELKDEVEQLKGYSEDQSSDDDINEQIKKLNGIKGELDNALIQADDNIKKIKGENKNIEVSVQKSIPGVMMTRSLSAFNRTDDLDKENDVNSSGGKTYVVMLPALIQSETWRNDSAQRMVNNIAANKYRLIVVGDTSKEVLETIENAAEGITVENCAKFDGLSGLAKNLGGPENTILVKDSFSWVRNADFAGQQIDINDESALNKTFQKTDENVIGEESDISPYSGTPDYQNNSSVISSQSNIEPVDNFDLSDMNGDDVNVANQRTYIVSLSALVNSEGKLADPNFTDKFLKMIVAKNAKLIVVGEEADNCKDLIQKSASKDPQAPQIDIKTIGSLGDLPLNSDDAAKTVFVSDNMLDIEAAKEKGIASKHICMDTKATRDANRQAVIDAKLALIDAIVATIKETKDNLAAYVTNDNTDTTIQNEELDDIEILDETSLNQDPPVEQQLSFLDKIKSTLSLEPSKSKKVANTIEKLEAEIGSIEKELSKLKDIPADSSDHNSAVLDAQPTRRASELFKKSKSLLNGTDKILKKLRNIDDGIFLYSDGNEVKMTKALNKVSTLLKHPLTLNHYRSQLVDTFIDDMVLTKAQILQVAKNIADANDTTSLFSGKVREKLFSSDKPAFHSDNKMRLFMDKINEVPQGKNEFKLSEIAAFLFKLDQGAKGFLSNQISINTKVPYVNIIIDAATGIAPEITNISENATRTHKFFDALGRAYRDPSSIDGPTQGFDHLKLSCSEVKAVLEALANDPKRGKSTSMLAALHQHGLFGKAPSVTNRLRYASEPIRVLVDAINKNPEGNINFGQLYRMLKNHPDNGKELADVLVKSVKGELSVDEVVGFAKSAVYDIGQKFAAKKAELENDSQSGSEIAPQ